MSRNCRGGAAGFSETGLLNWSDSGKPDPVVRCDGVERLTCGRSRRSPKRSINMLEKYPRAVAVRNSPMLLVKVCQLVV